ncbi:dihydrodipicolinate reductase [Celeribacter baekdonensis]|uniref:Dihydrodipicolinate reductase n=1 Tax=Celeribacter baekdonensis TaxID=875171 RepID=A0A2R4M6E5_9RHOB|nr:dihydrodipicolinate reductase [Celeribacter baekdonensis]AVW92770.1 dihydrodipicolinate reductase [Celeribacter baekdonensis]
MFRMALLVLAVPIAAQAEDLSRVETQSDFIATVEGRALTRLGITLEVRTDGRITGRAFGKDVSGDWTWRDGYFCRTLFHGADDLGPNCQVVAASADKIRFTADQGAGPSAGFSLR